MASKTFRLNKNGETLVITRQASETNGTITEFEGYDEPGIGPPFHVHFKQEEGVQVIKGTMRVKTAEKEFILTAGEQYIFKPGEAHKFWNDGNEQLHYKGYVKPALNYEYFIEHVYRSANEAGDDKPGAFDAAFLLTKYKSEFDILEIPRPVKVILFPVLIVLGRIFGKLKIYRDAPASLDYKNA